MIFRYSPVICNQMSFVINVKIYRAQLIHLEIFHWIYPPPHPPPTHQMFIINHRTRNHIQYIFMIAFENSLARKSLEIFQRFIASTYCIPKIHKYYWIFRQCGKNQESTKQLTISQLPYVTCFHLKRFEHQLNGTRNKIQTLVTFPENLVMD